MSDPAALKAQLKRLGDQRSALEADIEVRSGRLQAAGVGMDSPLVDAQGFPRADVDVAAIRADRHAIITQTNDHKALTRQMEQLLHQLHALSNQPGGSTAGGAAAGAGEPARAAAAALPAAAAQQTNVQHPAADLPPFAVVDELSQGSPAAAAGLQLWDQMLSFAGVTKQTPNTLQAVAAALQANEGRPVETVVLRQGAPAVLQLTPQPWGGRGLLGCHLRPL
ncbi:hypothetical protein COHA_006514 [Chlorella ohadii]|uniref:PDZ domain-containing protein n=1 Tax=Chlorella ohadii TaxID=2649997 RepID=A0AAD5DNT3_9CHLO|nr:hypothetical protein COHA_006514 [Chlorella ohadii]